MSFDHEWDDITPEMLIQVYYQIERYETAARLAPDDPIREIELCACLGPPPPQECRCKKRRRLVGEFMLRMEMKAQAGRIKKTWPIGYVWT